MTVEEWTQLVDLLQKAEEVGHTTDLFSNYVVITQADVFFAARCEAEKRMDE